MLSLRFSGSKFLMNLLRQFRVREFFRVHKIFRTQVFAGSAAFLFSLSGFQKCMSYVLGCSFIKTCSLTGC